MDGARERILQFCDYMLDVVEQSSEVSVMDKMMSCGVGIRFSEIACPGTLLVCIESIVDDSPAHHCGRIKQGDVLVLVDNTSVQGQPIQEVVDIVSGPPGTMVRLGFLASDSDYVEVRLERSALLDANGALRASDEASSSQLYGVGIIFQEAFVEGIARINVHSWREDSPVQQCGRVRVGDVLVMIDGQEVYGKSLSFIKERLPGAYGSEISLVFIDSESAYAAVRLRRIIPVGEARQKAMFGIGVGFAEDSSLEFPRVFITQLLPNTPAQMSAVLHEGDMLVAIDGKQVYGKGLEHLTTLIPGPAGTSVTLEVISQSDSKTKEVTLERTVPINGPRADTFRKAPPSSESHANALRQFRTPSAPGPTPASSRPLDPTIPHSAKAQGEAHPDNHAAPTPHSASVPHDSQPLQNSSAVANGHDGDAYESMASNLPSLLASRGAGKRRDAAQPSLGRSAAGRAASARQEQNPLSAHPVTRPPQQPSLSSRHI